MTRNQIWIVGSWEILGKQYLPITIHWICRISSIDHSIPWQLPFYEFKFSGVSLPRDYHRRTVPVNACASNPSLNEFNVASRSRPRFQYIQKDRPLSRIMSYIETNSNHFVNCRMRNCIGEINHFLILKKSCMNWLNWWYTCRWEFIFIFLLKRLSEINI